MSHNAIARKIRATLGRLAAVVAVMATVVSLSAAPAQADRADACEVVAGTVSSARNYIELCVVMEWSGANFAGYSRVLIHPGVYTTATNCKVTIYVDLRVGNGTPWSSGKNVQSCTQSLQPEWRGDSPDYLHFTSGTAANQWRGHVCADLYYNYSNNSGWQRCYVTGWWIAV